MVVKLCTPALNAAPGVILQAPVPSATVVPNTVVPSLSYSVTVAPASTAAPVMTGMVLVVKLSVLLEPESLAVAKSGVGDDGAAVSTVTVSKVPVVLGFPATSVCVTE